MTKETDATATVDGTPPVAEFDAPQATSEAAEETSVKQQEEEHPTDAEDTPDATPPVADPSREPDAPEAVRAEEASVKQQEDYLALFREAIISNYLFSGYSFDELRALATEFSFLELEEGSSVFEAGTDASFMLIVLRGGLRVAIGGNPVTEVCEGDLVGEAAVFLRSTGRTADCTVSQPHTVLATLDYDELPHLFTRLPQTGVKFLRTLLQVFQHRVSGALSDRLGAEALPAPPPTGGDEAARHVTMLETGHNLSFGLGENIKHADLVHLAQVMRIKRLPKGTKLFTKGQRGSQLAFVLQGCLQVLSGDGSRIDLVKAGQTLGVTALLSMEYTGNTCRPRDVVSIKEDTTCVVWDMDALDDLMTQQPDVVCRVLLNAAAAELSRMRSQHAPLPAAIAQHFALHPPPVVTPTAAADAADADDGVMTVEDIRRMLTFCCKFSPGWSEFTDAHINALLPHLQVMRVDEGDCILCTKWRATSLHFLLSGTAYVQTATRKNMRVGAGNLIGTMEWGDGRHWASNAVAAQHGTVVGVLSLAALESLGEVALEDGFSENLTVMMLRLAFSHAMHELTERMSDRVIMDERFDLKPQEGALEAHPEVFRWLLGESDSPTYESLRFVNSMQAARMRPGQVVMRVGDHVRALLVLMEGKVHSKLSETVLETLDPGSIVAVEHLMSHKSCKTDFVVAEDAILLIMSWDQLFHEFLSQPGVFGYSVMHSLVSLAAEHTVRDMTVVKAPKRKPAVKKGASLLVTAKAKAAFKSKVPKAKEAKLAAKLSAAETIQSDVGVDVRVRMLMHVQRTSPVWRMLSRSQLRPIAEVFHVFTVEPGERIVKRGERASFFGLVLSGEVYSEYAGETVDTFTVGHIFGLQPFFTQHHDYGGRSTNILAGDDCQVALFQYDLMDKLFVKDYEVGLKLINLMSQAVIKELTAFKRREHRQRLLALVGEDELVTSVPLQWEPLDLGGKMAAMTEFFDKFREKWGVGMFDEEMTEEEMVTLASLVKVATVEPGQLVVKAAAEAPVAYLILSGSLEKKQVDRLSFVDKSSVLSQRFAGDIAGAGIVMRELVGISNLEDEVDWYCGTETSSRVAVFSMEQAKFRELSDVVLMRLMINMGQISTAKLLETLQVTAAKCLSSKSLPLHTKWDTVHRSRRLSISEIEHVVQEANANAHRQKSVVQQEVQQAQGLVYGEDLSRQMTRAGAKGSLRHQDLSLLMKAVSASSRFWYGFTDHELHMLSQSMELVHAPKGEFVCQAGHESDFAGIVIQGYVNVVNVDDQVLATMYVGDGLAQTTYFHSGIDALGLVSMDDTLIAKISPHSLEMLKDRFPKIAQRAIKLFLQCTLTLLSEATLTFHESAKLTPKVMNQFALHNLLQKTAGAKRKAFKNDFSDLEIEKILQCMFICKVPKGAPMLVYGQEARIVGYIMDGVAEARIGFSDEVARWMNEGEWVGADSFTSSYMSRATYLQNYYASGASAVTIAAISISQYRTLCKKHPSVGYRLFHSLASERIDVFRADLTKMGVSMDTCAAQGFPSAVVGDASQDHIESFWSEHPKTAAAGAGGQRSGQRKLTKLQIHTPLGHEDSIVFVRTHSATTPTGAPLPLAVEAAQADSSFSTLLSPTIQGVILEFGNGGSMKARNLSRRTSRGTSRSTSAFGRSASFLLDEQFSRQHSGATSTAADTAYSSSIFSPSTPCVTELDDPATTNTASATAIAPHDLPEEDSNTFHTLPTVFYASTSTKRAQTRGRHSSMHSSIEGSVPTIDEVEAEEPERSLTGVVPMPSRRGAEGNDAREADADAASIETEEDPPEQAAASATVAASARSSTGVVPMPSRRREEGNSMDAAQTGWDDPPEESEQASASGARTVDATAEATKPQKPTSSRTFRAKGLTRPTVRFAVQDYRTHTPRALTRQQAIAEYNAGIAATRALMQAQGGERNYGPERDNAGPPQTLGDYQYQHAHQQHYTHSMEASRATNSDDGARQHPATHALPPPQQQQPGYDWMLDHRSSGDHHEAGSAATRGRYVPGGWPETHINSDELYDKYLQPQPWERELAAMGAAAEEVGVPAPMPKNLSLMGESQLPEGLAAPAAPPSRSVPYARFVPYAPQRNYNQRSTNAQLGRWKGSNYWYKVKKPQATAAARQPRAAGITAPTTRERAYGAVASGAAHRYEPNLSAFSSSGGPHPEQVEVVWDSSIMPITKAKMPQREQVITRYRPRTFTMDEEVAMHRNGGSSLDRPLPPPPLPASGVHRDYVPYVPPLPRREADDSVTVRAWRPPRLVPLQNPHTAPSTSGRSVRLAGGGVPRAMGRWAYSVS